MTRDDESISHSRFHVRCLQFTSHFENPLIEQLQDFPDKIKGSEVQAMSACPPSPGVSGSFWKGRNDYASEKETKRGYKT